MLELLRTVLRSAVSALRPGRDLALENLAVRHQLAVLQRGSKRPQLNDTDRLLWISLKRIWPRWDEVLQLVQPATVVKWHRAGFRFYWRRKGRSRAGRPRIDAHLRKLIRKQPVRLQSENRLFVSDRPGPGFSADEQVIESR